MLSYKLFGLFCYNFIQLEFLYHSLWHVLLHPTHSILIYSMKLLLSPETLNHLLSLSCLTYQIILNL
jgi:hypothetical protein